MQCMSHCQVQDFRSKSANETRTECRSIDVVFRVRASDSDERGNDPVVLCDLKNNLSTYNFTTLEEPEFLIDFLLENLSVIGRRADLVSSGRGQSDSKSKSNLRRVTRNGVKSMRTVRALCAQPGKARTHTRASGECSTWAHRCRM